MDAKIVALVEERKKLDHDSRVILDHAEAENRVLTGSENDQWDRMNADIERISAEIDKRERQAARETELARSRGVKTIPAGTESAGHDGTAQDRQVLKWSGGIDVPIGPGKALLQERAAPEYIRASKGYLRDGRISAVLQTAPDTRGGYLTATTILQRLIKAVDNLSFMRGLSTVLPPLSEAVGIGCPTLDTDPGDADWTAEVPASDITEDTDMALGKREMYPHLLTKLIWISHKLLRAGVMDIEQIVASRLAYKFGVTEEKGFLVGTGDHMPLGCFIASADGISTGQDVRTTSATAFTSDDLLDVQYNLKGQYQNRATWLVSREFVKRARKLKTGEGEYLWAPGLVGEPSTILNRPFKMSEYVPSTFTANLYVALLADFKTGYWIVDSLQFGIQRLIELGALRNRTGFLGRRETDGMPVLEEAFSRLQMHA